MIDKGHFFFSHKVAHHKKPHTVHPVEQSPSGEKREKDHQHREVFSKHFLFTGSREKKKHRVTGVGEKMEEWRGERLTFSWELSQCYEGTHTHTHTHTRQNIKKKRTDSYPSEQRTQTHQLKRLRSVGRSAGDAAAAARHCAKSVKESRDSRQKEREN